MNASSPRQSEGEYSPVEPGRYVYGVTRRGQGLELGAVGIVRGTRVFPVEHADLAAVVSETPLVEFDATRENVAAHGVVVEMLMRLHPVVPLPFGTVLAGDDSVRDHLAGTYELYDQLLSRVRDKVEVTVRATWDRDLERNAIERDDDEIGELAAEISRDTRGSTFFRRAKLARLVEERLAERAARHAGELLAAMGPVATAVRHRESAADRTLLVASVLIGRDALPRMDDVLASLSPELRASVAIAVGPPRPPHEFVTTSLEPERRRSR